MTTAREHALRASNLADVAEQAFAQVKPTTQQAIDMATVHAWTAVALAWTDIDDSRTVDLDTFKIGGTDDE